MGPHVLEKSLPFFSTVHSFTEKQDKQQPAGNQNQLLSSMDSFSKKRDDTSVCDEVVDAVQKQNAQKTKTSKDHTIGNITLGDDDMTKLVVDLSKSLDDPSLLFD